MNGSLFPSGERSRDGIGKIMVDPLKDNLSSRRDGSVNISEASPAKAVDSLGRGIRLQKSLEAATSDLRPGMDCSGRTVSDIMNQLKEAWIEQA
jgi:hypothetical protein